MSELIDREKLKSKIHYTDDYYETPYVEWDDILEQPTVAAPNIHIELWERMRTELTELHENNADKPDVEVVTRFLLNWMKAVEKE